MTILKTSREFTKVETYKLTLDSKVTSLKNYVGSVLPITGYIQYEDTNSKDEVNTILSLETDDGTIIATNSETVTRAFFQMLDIMETLPFKVEVIQGTSKSGRDFLDLSLAEE